MPAIAPAAPGRLGEPIDPQRFLTYLNELTGWITSRREELDELDAAVQRSEHATELTADIRLGLALWQAIKVRQDALLTTWDSGRVRPGDTDRLSALVWGRLDTTASDATLSGMTVSLPEACRLSDALTAQLRDRLQLDPAGSQALARIRDLRASLERLRDQVGLEPGDAQPAARSKLAQLEARVTEVADKAGRGGDVGGLLGPLEIETATFERDLIVGGVNRRQNAARTHEVDALRDTLAARQPGLRELVDKAVALVTPAPKYAVPDVAALGPMPTDGAGLAAYGERLAQVGRAMDHVQEAYGQAIADHGALVSTLDALAAGPHADDPTLVTLVASARGVLDQRPCPIGTARPLVTACQQYAAWREAPEGGR